MFTGIIEEVGTVLALEHLDGGGARLHVDGPLATSDAHLGDSIAVSGVCLTVSSLPTDRPGSFTSDLMPETLTRSVAASWAVGSRVDLERSVRADGRLGGHVVQGHVDGVGTVLERVRGERWDDLVIGLDADFNRFVAEKGAITVSGVSLTVTGVGPDRFSVSLIPTTLSATTLGGLRVGDPVNIEVDVVAKYLDRLLQTGSSPALTSGVTQDSR